MFGARLALSTSLLPLLQCVCCIELAERMCVLLVFEGKAVCLKQFALCLTQYLTLKIVAVFLASDPVGPESTQHNSNSSKNPNICTGYEIQLRSVCGGELPSERLCICVCAGDLFFIYFTWILYFWCTWNTRHTPCFSVREAERENEREREHMFSVDMFIKCGWTMDFIGIFSPKWHPVGIIFSFQLIFCCRLSRTTCRLLQAHWSAA